MQIRDVMIHEVTGVRPDEQLRVASEKMHALGVHFLPVYDGRQVVGVLTQESLQTFASRTGLASGTHHVQEAMSRDFVRCATDDQVSKVSEQVSAHGPGDLRLEVVVLNQDDTLAGVVPHQVLHGEDTGQRTGVTGSLGASQPMVGIDENTVDHRSEGSFPASDPPPPQATT